MRLPKSIHALNVCIYNIHALEHGAITFTDHNRSTSIAPTTKIQWKMFRPFLSISFLLAYAMSSNVLHRKKNYAQEEILWCICKDPHQHFIFVHCAMAKPMSAFPQPLCAVYAHRPTNECFSSDMGSKMAEKNQIHKQSILTHFLKKPNANKNIFTSNAKSLLFHALSFLSLFLAFIVFLSFWPVFSTHNVVCNHLFLFI